MSRNALLIGNSDGIGLAVTKELLGRGWQVVGISRSESPVKNSSYEHIVLNVQDAEYVAKLKWILKQGDPIEVCIFCAGIGELLDLAHMEQEVEVIDVNLLAMVKAAGCVVPGMVQRGSGHVIGLSSLADELLSPQAPSYHASKAGFSNYLESLALALKPTGVCVTNVRFGFVDTKMAKGEVRPFMMSVDRAARHVMRCVDKRPMRYSAPWAMIPLVKLRDLTLRLSVFWFSLRGAR